MEGSGFWSHGSSWVGMCLLIWILWKMAEVEWVVVAGRCREGLRPNDEVEE